MDFVERFIIEWGGRGKCAGEIVFHPQCPCWLPLSLLLSFSNQSSSLTQRSEEDNDDDAVNRDDDDDAPSSKRHSTQTIHTFGASIEHYMALMTATTTTTTRFGAQHTHTPTHTHSKVIHFLFPAPRGERDGTHVGFKFEIYKGAHFSMGAFTRTLCEFGQYWPDQSTPEE